MPDPDRRTTIHGDQIEDGTVNAGDLDTVQQAGAIPIPDKAGLAWNEAEGRMDWVLNTFGGFSIYDSSEGETITTSLVPQDKLNYVTPTLEPALYRYAIIFEAESSANTHGFISKFFIDDVEYNYISNNHDDYTTYTGMAQITHSVEETHTVRVTVASDKANKSVSIRRARLEIWRVS